MASLAFSYRLGVSMVSNACDAINLRMVGTCMPPPTEDEWRGIAARFMERWNFPNCIGALDGKHVSIQAPPGSGTLYFNYKKNFSVVLLALVDADYRFRVVHIGAYGRASDGGVLAASALGRGLEAATLNGPQDAVIPAAQHPGDMPFTVIGDAAFPLKTYLMRPYPGRDISLERRIFNYRLSRARNVVENAFGILTSRWQIFKQSLSVHPNKVDAIVLATCILHNFHLKPADNQRWLDEQEGNNLEDMERMRLGNRGGQAAHVVRDKLCQYFNSPLGSVQWQNRMV
jgi:hypothetical protein